MVTSTEVRARVTASFDLPSWPNPHADGAPARDEEYTRVTNPERYEIVHARARLWAEHLGELPGVSVEDGVRITSSRPGALSLFLLTDNVPVTDAEDATLAVLRVAVARPDLVITTLPDCGCDACDWGSADLLDAIDEAIVSVIGGPFVVVRGPGWQAQWYPGGGVSGGGTDHAVAIDLCRRLAAGEDVRLPDGAEAFVGRPWFG
ncbi:DUF6226 family protein [Allokutzneria sp. A3M-2-11 16]|uniref:DUF6226 family protein n=1 Tax=Allokutzneria sp. A3M-2-11 16 TaxID=2962043 RepID=UPI0020B65571|nr:DUF6226 family protein [Allokutzneria sp. A3M-2-11 16]MCP3803500.1 DUF6226 family protein [Allokutzneria sp. A3M-2-11 16]